MTELTYVCDACGTTLRVAAVLASQWPEVIKHQLAITKAMHETHACAGPRLLAYREALAAMNTGLDVRPLG